IWVLDRGKGFDWDENGEPWRLAGTHLDITERKRIEENLLESEERFRLFMDHNPAIAWIKNEEGRYVYLNKSYQQRFCASLDDWRGKTDFELWPADAAERFRRSDLMTLAARKPIEILKKYRK
ncbi:MAG: PAS domain-containing protein, partial [Candidatus Competibacter sp.]|nr:PAS domain-containing protein [Candidatus Competibacter sp.]